MPVTPSWIDLTRAIRPSASAWLPKVVPATKVAVRRSRPRMSVRKLEWSQTPASASGCRACSSSAAMPPAIIEVKSPCTRQQTASGPNSPGSPGGEEKSMLGPPPPEVSRVMPPARWRRRRSASRCPGALVLGSRGGSDISRLPLPG
ncbi:hypothetical protein XF14_09815 [Burkholderia gladioli]|nr:hypothetical protein XF14_09815 [Burkholderia gladioli]